MPPRLSLPSLLFHFPSRLEATRGTANTALWTQQQQRLFSTRKDKPTKDHLSSEERLEQEIEGIRSAVDKYKKQLRKHVLSSYKSRELSSSISALRLTMADAERKKAAGAAASAAANAIANIPAHVSIEVLSNGTAQLPPCVAIRTPLKTYLFNCPEGTSRFLPAIRLKAPNVFDIFITRGVWQNIGGISSILLAKESNSLPTRLHGAVNMKHFLECIRPFQDSDFGSVKYPSSVDEYTLATHGSYEDAGVRVTYIPLLPHGIATTTSNGVEAKRRKNETDVAYLVELKAPARKIDPLKLMSMKVPKGPLIGKLKAGEAITLPDGRSVQPDDVLSEECSGAGDRPRLLILDCASEEYTHSLYHSDILQPFVSSGSNDSTVRLDYVVHFSPQAVLSSPQYLEWMHSLGPQCRHIVVNGSGPCVPGIDSIYNHARLLTQLQPALFNELHPAGWRGVVTQEADLGVQESAQTEKGDVVEWTKTAPLQRWWMRRGQGDDPIVLDLKERTVGSSGSNGTNVEEDWRKDAAPFIQAALQGGDGALTPETSSFPRVTFLGTSSATPSKYRNVSGYLFETSPSAAFLVDVGEGTYGQLNVILHEQQCIEMLLRLHAVFITHAHQDHMNGLYTIIEKRRDAFALTGVTYRPLVLVCNRNVRKPLKTYTHCFEDLEQYVQVVDLATSSGVPYTQPPSPKRQRQGSPNRTNEPPFKSYPLELAPTTSDLIAKMPTELYNAEEWSLQGATAVQVHHTRMANGFVFTTNGKKVVFSGDTKPCDLLVEQGRDADLLIHESTFEDGHEQDAFRKKHSTMGQAIDVGKRMGAKNIILTHFSARYPKVPPLPSYLDDSKIGVAMDGLRVGFDRLHLVPLMTPIYREVYKDDLFDIELKKSQREWRKREEEGEAKKKEEDQNENGREDNEKKKIVRKV